MLNPFKINLDLVKGECAILISGEFGFDLELLKQLMCTLDSTFEKFSINNIAVTPDSIMITGGFEVPVEEHSVIEKSSTAVYSRVDNIIETLSLYLADSNLKCITV